MVSGVIWHSLAENGHFTSSKKMITNHTIWGACQIWPFLRNNYTWRLNAQPSCFLKLCHCCAFKFSPVPQSSCINTVKLCDFRCKFCLILCFADPQLAWSHTQRSANHSGLAASLFLNTCSKLVTNCGYTTLIKEEIGQGMLTVIVIRF